MFDFSTSVEGTEVSPSPSPLIMALSESELVVSFARFVTGPSFPALTSLSGSLQSIASYLVSPEVVDSSEGSDEEEVEEDEEDEEEEEDPSSSFDFNIDLSSTRK